MTNVNFLWYTKENGGYKDIRKTNFDNIAFVFFSEKT